MRVNGDEGTPVPIPNTVVKLVNGDNTWLATARKDNKARTQKAVSYETAFSFSVKMIFAILCPRVYNNTQMVYFIRSFHDAGFHTIRCTIYRLR